MRRQPMQPGWNTYASVCLIKDDLLHEPRLSVQPGFACWKRWLSELGEGGIGSRTSHSADADAPARWVLVLAIVNRLGSYPT